MPELEAVYDGVPHGTAFAPLTDRIVVRKASGPNPFESFKGTQIIGRIPVGDVTPSGGVADLDAVDGNYATMSSTANLTGFVLAEGKKFTLEFTANGGNIVAGASLTVQGKQITGRAAGDIAELVGLAGSAVQLTNYIRKSGAPARPFIFNCRVASYSNINIATALNNGDVLNGVTLATGDIVLVRQQTTATQNGVYVVGVSPARHSSFTAFDDHLGLLFDVAEGTEDAPGIFACSSTPGGVLGTNDITFSIVSGRAGRMATYAEFVKLINTGLYMKALGGNFYTLVRMGDVQTAARSLLIYCGDNDRSIRLEGNVTLSDVLVRVTPVPYASLPVAPTLGMIAVVNDSTTSVWGDRVTSGGSSKEVGVMYRNGDWFVFAGE